jgi:hypothetical protein
MVQERSDVEGERSQATHENETSRIRPLCPPGPKADKSADVDINQGAGSGLCRIHGGTNLFHHASHQVPSASAENNDGELATLKILLITQVLVGCEQDVKPRVLSSSRHIVIT